MHRLFFAVGSLVVEHGLCGVSAWLPRGTCYLPRPRIKLVSPALAGKFLITGSLGKSRVIHIYILFINLFFGCARPSLFLCGLSLVAEGGATLRCGAWASHCTGFS